MLAAQDEVRRCGRNPGFRIFLEPRALKGRQLRLRKFLVVSHTLPVSDGFPHRYLDGGCFDTKKERKIICGI
jgi:hypothetical protein